MNTEMDFLVCERILRNQEKIKNKEKIKNPIVFNTQLPSKDEKNENEKKFKRLTCIKCGQDELWCYCMYY